MGALNKRHGVNDAALLVEGRERNVKIRHEVSSDSLNRYTTSSGGEFARSRKEKPREPTWLNAGNTVENSNVLASRHWFNSDTNSTDARSGT